LEASCYDGLFEAAARYPEYPGHSVNELFDRVRAFEALRMQAQREDNEVDSDAVEYDYYYHRFFFSDCSEENEDMLMSDLVERRFEALRVKLVKNGCELRGDSRFCREYVNLETTASIEEIVATLIISKALFSYSHAVWSDMREDTENLLEQYVYTKKHEWIVAANIIIGSEPFNAEARSIHASYEEEIRMRRRYNAEYDTYDSESDRYDSDGTENEYC
jgi:hypothetical protein